MPASAAQGDVAAQSSTPFSRLTISTIALANFLGGACLGLLLGLLVGMSSTPVVANVIAAFTAAMIAFIGLRANDSPNSPSDETSRSSSALARTSGFALACVASVLLGLFIRTHDLLSPTLADRAKIWEQLGFSPAETRAILLYQQANVVPESWKFSPSEKATTQSSLLYGSEASLCAEARPERFANTAETLQAWKKFGGIWERTSELIAHNVAPEKQDNAVKEAHQMICAAALR